MKKTQFSNLRLNISLLIYFLLLASCNSSLNNTADLLPRNKTESLTTLSFSEIQIQNNDLTFNLNLSKTSPLTINFYIFLENTKGETINLENANFRCEDLNYNSSFLDCNKHSKLYKWTFTSGKHTANIRFPLQKKNLEENFTLKVITFNPLIAKANQENKLTGKNIFFKKNSLVQSPDILNILENYPNLYVPLILNTNRSFTIEYEIKKITAETLYLLNNTRSIATEDLDFIKSEGRFVISPDKPLHEININTIDDKIYEGSQSFVLVLKSNEAIFEGQRKKNILINIDDDEEAPYLQISNFIASEENNIQEWPVALSWPSEITLSFQYTLHSTWLNNAEQVTDYIPDTNQIHFPPHSTQQFIPISIVQDNVPEDTESFSLSITPSSALQLESYETSTYTAFITNTSEGLVPNVQFSTTHLNTKKGYQINIPVELKGATNTPVKVYYRSFSNTALASQDFEDKAGVLYFPPSAYSQIQNIRLQILDKKSLEHKTKKSFYLYIEKVHNGKISTNRKVDIHIL